MTEAVTIYSTSWCCDCRRVKNFLRDRKVAFREVNVLRVNNGRRKVPTLEVAGRFFACSPFDPHRLAEELKIPLNS
jgi:glutaredoxin